MKPTALLSITADHFPPPPIPTHTDSSPHLCSTTPASNPSLFLKTQRLSDAATGGWVGGGRVRWGGDRVGWGWAGYKISIRNSTLRQQQQPPNGYWFSASAGVRLTVATVAVATTTTTTTANTTSSSMTSRAPENKLQTTNRATTTATADRLQDCYGRRKSDVTLKYTI